MSAIDKKIDARFDKIESDLLVIKRMIGVVIVVNVLPILKTEFFQ